MEHKKSLLFCCKCHTAFELITDDMDDILTPEQMKTGKAYCQNCAETHRPCIIYRANAKEFLERISNATIITTKIN